MKTGSILRVLTYHRVANPEQIHPSDPRLVSATPEMFARHMQWLAKHYQVIDMSVAVEAIASGSPLPRRAVLITFDDGYPDFLQHAWPVLRKFQLPATLFVPTAFPDQPDSAFWWDRLYATVITSTETEITDPALGRLPLHTRQEREHSARILQNHVKSLQHTEAMAWIDDLCQRIASQEIVTPGILGWEELKSLSEAGITIGAHSRTHPLMTRISSEQVHEEISGSQQDIENRLGKTLPVFCYPAGACNETICNIARDAGILLGFSTRLGHNRIGSCDPLCLRRINITQRTTPAVLRGRLSRTGIHADILRHKVKLWLRSR